MGYVKKFAYLLKILLFLFKCHLPTPGSPDIQQGELSSMNRLFV